MGKLGGFGSLSFVVSSNTIRTFEKLQWDVGASYATHDRHMMPDLLEFLGPDPETINLPIKFSVFLGTNPIQEVERLRAMIRSGRWNVWCWAATSTGAINGPLPKCPQN